jgi:hypothetical protein
MIEDSFDAFLVNIQCPKYWANIHITIDTESFMVIDECEVIHNFGSLAAHSNTLYSELYRKFIMDARELIRRAVNDPEFTHEHLVLSLHMLDEHNFIPRSSNA